MVDALRAALNMTELAVVSGSPREAYGNQEDILILPGGWFVTVPGETPPVPRPGARRHFWIIFFATVAIAIAASQFTGWWLKFRTKPTELFTYGSKADGKPVFESCKHWRMKILWSLLFVHQLFMGMVLKQI